MRRWPTGHHSPAASTNSAWNGTGSFGAGLTHRLSTQARLTMVEVDRSDRKMRRGGKSNLIDAEVAAWSASPSITTDRPDYAVCNKYVCGDLLSAASGPSLKSFYHFV
jgi:transposase